MCTYVVEESPFTGYFDYAMSEAEYEFFTQAASAVGETLEQYTRTSMLMLVMGKLSMN